MKADSPLKAFIQGIIVVIVGLLFIFLAIRYSGPITDFERQNHMGQYKWKYIEVVSPDGVHYWKGDHELTPRIGRDGEVVVDK